ncbi:DUF3109 family protein [Compostibacter hankyongensis]|uniref:DUF3109 family protein n=1 Tax=Compostibacter hankyongensis TaxID=1007089 RepID=A0ABP8FDJ6_9BACT
MIIIDKVLISDEAVEEQFVCDLEACKGGCCVDGDAGAPLSEDELPVLDRIYEQVKPYLTPEGVAEIEKQGRHVYEKGFGAVTPTIRHQICVYGIIENGIVKCGIEKAWNEGKTDFKKPLSCHLYPFRISRQDGYEAINYEPREQLCRAACKLGKRLKVPVYRFLKEALIRKYGSAFYEALDTIGRKWKKKT